MKKKCSKKRSPFHHAIASPRSYLSEKRHDHPMDVFFYPEMCNPVNEHMLAGDTVWEQPRTQYSGYGEIL
jgi:hypothetical protein